MRPVSGRHVRLVAVVGSALAVAVGSASAAVQAPAASDASAVVSGSYAGTLDGVPVGVAVVAQAPAAEGQPRTVSMFVCNGTSLAVLLTGQAPGNSAVLRSADRRFNARVTLTPRTASGVLAIPGGKQYRFSVPTTAAVAGLFDITVSRSGVVEGRSATGATLTGQIGVGGKLPLAGALAVTARTGGAALKLTAVARRLAPGSYRWIVLSNGKVFGANKRGIASGGIGGLRIARLPGVKVTRIQAGSAGQPGWGDAECQKLADAWEKTVDLQADAIAKGDAKTAHEAGVVAGAAWDTLTDHCMVIGGGA
jgi:hypothetical protein